MDEFPSKFPEIKIPNFELLSDEGILEAHDALLTHQTAVFEDLTRLEDVMVDRQIPIPLEGDEHRLIE